MYDNKTKKIVTPLIPTDVKIYTEDGTQYLDYTGTCYMSDGCKYKIHLPKVGLNFTQITQKEDNEYFDICGYKRKILLNFNVLVTDGVFYKYEILEREVSKNSLKKSLVIK